MSTPRVVLAAGPGRAVAAAMGDGLVPHDFETERIFAAVNSRLFGGEVLRIGKFRVLRRIGSGGMGEVYLCEDEDLRRKVAVKLVLGCERPRDQARLRMEAQALAQLRHANVVQVYEVGEHEGRTFVAMEYVEGQTLGAWLRGDHARREVLEQFMAAGRGLAAVHHAGLVHRDFKPENVLIGDDGLARVVDFGLVLGSDLVDQQQAGDPRSAQSGPQRSETQPVVGTARYMPLEQLRGEGVGAHSDQFAFCTALYEALWGEPPFHARGVSNRIAVLDRASAKVPRTMRAQFRVIRRGLERDPSRRWPSMDVLLDELAAIPRRRLRWAKAGALSASLGVIAMGGFAIVETRPPTCNRELAGVWDAEDRTALRDHVEPFTASHTDDSLRLITSLLDAWKDAWEDEQAVVCDALEDRQDERAVAEANAQHACLWQLRHRVGTIVDQLRNGDAAVLAEGVFAVANLPHPQECATPLGMSGAELPSAFASEIVEVVRADIDKAHELRLLGRRAEGLAIARAAEAAATKLGYGPLLAEARSELGKAYGINDLERARSLLTSAYELTEAAQHYQLRADVMTHLAEFARHDKLGKVEALLWIARTVNNAAGADPRLAARLELLAGRIAKDRNAPAEAAKHFQNAIALASHNTPELPDYLDALAGTMSGDKSLAQYRLAIAKAEELFGPRHPRTAKYVYNYGLRLLEQDKPNAEQQLTLAAEIWLEDPDTQLPRLMNALIVLSDEALQRDDVRAAEQYADRAAGAIDRSRPVNHPDYADLEFLRARIESVRGDHDAMVEHAYAAIKRLEPTDDARPDLRVRLWLAEQLVALGRLEEALAVLAVALAPSNNPSGIATEHLDTAELELRRGDLDRATKALNLAITEAYEL